MASSAGLRQDSTGSTPISLQNLSPAQVQVIAELAQGSSVTKAAAAAGIHRTTVYNWQHNSAEFRAAAQEARSQFAAALADQVRDLSGVALQTLHDLLTAAETPPAVRVKIALAVLNRPQFPDRGWQLPERIESSDEQKVLDGLAALDADYRASLKSDALARASYKAE